MQITTTQSLLNVKYFLRFLETDTLVLNLLPGSMAKEFSQSLPNGLALKTHLDPEESNFLLPPSNAVKMKK